MRIGRPTKLLNVTSEEREKLNLVERLFAEVTERCVRRGSHTAARDLETAMLDYLDRRKSQPKAIHLEGWRDLEQGRETEIR